MKNKLRIGIEAYQYEQKVILRLIKMKGGLSDTDFDRLFSDYKKVAKNCIISNIYRRPKLRFFHMTRNSFILGGFPPNDWAKWLELTQIMCTIGLIKTEFKNGHVIYKTV